MTIEYDILIIDDDRDLVNAMRMVLLKERYIVRVAYNSKDGLKDIAEKIPDLIILDVMMDTPTEGFDFTYRLRNQKKYQNIPILMLTSFVKKLEEMGTEPFEHILGEDWPVNIFMEKPVDPDLLLKTVEELVQGDATA